MGSAMKALVYTAKECSEIQEVPAAEPSAGEVIIDVSFCGICGSDMHAWHGKDERRLPPLILGHEAVGIAQTGKYKGKKVAINPLITCGTCEACKNDNEHLCPERNMIGMRKPGAMAEQVAISEANLTPLSESLTLEDAALAEPLACAIHAVKLTEIKNTEREVIILGGGAIGLLAAMVFAHYGFKFLKIAETNPIRRKLLDTLGFNCYDPLAKTTPLIADIVFDAVGAKATRESASAIAKPGGEIIHIGLQDNSGGIDTRRLTLQEISFLGSYCYRRSDFAETVALLEDGVITGKGWAEIRSLEEGAASFLAIDEGHAPPKIILAT